MRRFINLLLLLWIVSTSSYAAMLSMELTRGVAGAIPIAIVPFAAEQDLPQNVSNIISNDLQNSGRFKVSGQGALSSFPSEGHQVTAEFFRRAGVDYVVIGKVSNVSSGRYQISFQLLEPLGGEGAGNILLNKQFTVSSQQLRALSHHISDLVYQQLTGMRGIFSTKLAYIVVMQNQEGRSRYSLEVADQDGYNPRTLLTSSEPIMSPAWSPHGRQLAYVSFENQRANIYLQDLATGGRRLVSAFAGINGAPSFSPDGKKLALVLSKSGSPNIYVMDLASGRLAQITHDFYINTEPAWSPDGRFLLFTSTRSGGPQIYQFNLATAKAVRLTYDGDYNARAAYSSDGNHIIMIHRASSIYNIGVLDLDTGTMRVLNPSASDSSSPSVAPNGSMILYDMVYGNRNVLAMVSADGRVQLRLPIQNGEAQDPAWSPFL